MGNIPDIDLTTPGVLDLRVAPEAKVRIAGDQKRPIDGTMWRVANHATLTHRFMLEDKRPRLLAMTLRAALVQPRHGQTTCRFQNIRTVRIMALHAIHAFFQYGMVLRQVEFSLRLEVALKTRSWVLTRIDNEFAAATARFDVLARWPVT